ncbi:putative ferulic acid Esterase/Feruloyl esterase [Xylariaceae sp. FL1019]|nr:putative ferulic acid Esterase/Feruloyl esterase [Xylariaceae sp. FL1019]
MIYIDILRRLAVTLSWLVVICNSTTERRRPVANRCVPSTFTPILSEHNVIERVEYVEAGSTYGEGIADLGYPIQPTNLPPLCAITISVATSSTSAYRIGMFLPAEWNQRFLAVGNGGFAGGINWLDMGAGVHYGFAVVSTDTGHNSNVTDITWAFNNTNSKMDWGWRAVHGSVILGKRMTETYFGQPISYSYWSGCSTGGRQGLKEVQISPRSFDGLLIGSPAWYTSHLNPWVANIATYNWPADDAKHIDWRLFNGIAAEVVKQCDDIDGVVDGIISIPEQCNVNYTALSCDNAGTNQSACLTEAQSETLKKVYRDWTTPTDEFLYKGLTAGSEGQMYAVLNYSSSSPYGIGYLQNFLLDDKSFTLANFNDSIVWLAEKLDPGNATADDYDLTVFRNRGGKMLMYHGTADGLVPMKGSNVYYDRTVKTMGGNMTATKEFFRYFMVPGMQHCFTTAVDSPWAFGGASQAGFLGNHTWSVPGFVDAQHDILLSLVDWVEKGAAVDSVVATTWNEQLNVTSGVLKQRPICPYPQLAKWDGTGDLNDAQSWACGGDINAPVMPTSTSTPSATASPSNAAVSVKDQPGVIAAIASSMLLLEML